MATEKMSIWEAARQDAAKRTKSVSKNKKRVKRQSVTKTPIALMRLTLLVMMGYALFHYIPAFINIKPVLAQTTAQSGAISQIEGRKKWGLMAPLRDQLKIRKAYLRKGQTIQAQYVLPAGTQANITLKQCKRIIFIEAFNCDIVQAETLDLTGQTSGTRRFLVSESAMYFFESHVEINSDDPFDITWRRN